MGSLYIPHFGEPRLMLIRKNLRSLSFPTVRKNDCLTGHSDADAGCEGKYVHNDEGAAFGKSLYALQSPFKANIKWSLIPVCHVSMIVQFLKICPFSFLSVPNSQRNSV